MKLYLVRHAKTDPHSITGKDFDRKLLPRGKQQALDLSHFLNEHKIQVEKVLCSSAIRTKETWGYLSDKWTAPIEFTSELYLCNHLKMLQLINNSNCHENLMIIGHNEGISELATYLSGATIHMKTGMLVELSFQVSNWTELTCDSASFTQMYRSSAR